MKQRPSKKARMKKTSKEKASSTQNTTAILSQAELSQWAMMRMRSTLLPTLTLTSSGNCQTQWSAVLKKALKKAKHTMQP